MVVVEDIDSLFAKDSSAKNPKPPLSFSVLLNALDGVGSASGQVSSLTQSHPSPPWPSCQAPRYVRPA